MENKYKKEDALKEKIRARVLELKKDPSFMAKIEGELIRAHGSDVRLSRYIKHASKLSESEVILSERLKKK